MKKYVLCLFLLLYIMAGFSQDIPSQKELEAMMKEAQKELDNMDPETKKMMDSMGIKMPSMNSIPTFTDAEIKKAYEDANRIVPVRDVARIGSIPKARLAAASLPGYVSATHSKVVPSLKAASKTKGEEIYRAIKAQHNSPAVTGKTAAGLWMLGKTELALYVMGKACIDDPANTDNMSNYAAMLSMAGGEQMAIPMLEYLNRKFPKNSTLLNNLGQAWFGLGELDKAGKYLDSTIRIYSFHSQANLTKSRIEESKGNKTAAIASLKKSIKTAYTSDKQNRLNQLGYDLQSKDIDWHAPMPKDALGLEKFFTPGYPMNVYDSEVKEKEWAAFRALCQAEMDEINAQLGPLIKASEQAQQKRAAELMKASQTGAIVYPFPPLAEKAFVKLAYLVTDKDGRMTHQGEKTYEEMENALATLQSLETTLEDRIKKLDEAYRDRFGEGKENPFEEACESYNNAYDAYLSSANKTLSLTSKNYLDNLLRTLNDQTYYNQYTMWPEDFEVAKANAKLRWVSTLYSQKVVFKNRNFHCSHEELKTKPAKLSDFDDVNCQYHSTLNLPLGSIQVDCSRMTTNLSVGFLKLGLKQDMNQQTFGDQFMSCSVEVGAGISKGVNMGPLKAEASIGGGVAVEIDRQGISDVVIKAGAGYSAGTDIIEGGSHSGVGVSDLSVDVGVQGQISLISGHSSVESTGILSGAFKK